MINIHATLVKLKNKGILIIGKSGSGKSDLALRLIMDKKAKLVADDRVDIENGDETDDVDRNWIQMMFYHCENKRTPEKIYSQDFCALLKKVYELHSRLINYDYPQDYYNSEKKRLISTYENYPITKIDFSDIPEDERLRKRNEIMKAEWEKTNQKNDSN